MGRLVFQLRLPRRSGQQLIVTQVRASGPRHGQWSPRSTRPSPRCWASSPDPSPRVPYNPGECASGSWIKIGWNDRGELTVRLSSSEPGFLLIPANVGFVRGIRRSARVNARDSSAAAGRWRIRLSSPGGRTAAPDIVAGPVSSVNCCVAKPGACESFADLLEQAVSASLILR